MIVGFTGSRNGMSDKQCIELNEKFKELNITVLHHGCCIGADEQAHAIARIMMTGIHICGHPGIGTNTMSSCDYFYKPKPFLDRNRDIVDDCEILFVAPDGPEKMRSGTWSTKRYAQKVNKKFHILEP